jgi:hypothetical protein
VENVNRTPVTCNACRHFINNLDIPKSDKLGNQYGSSDGIGQCQLFNNFMAQKPSVTAINKAVAAIGSKLLYPRVERFCTKFEAR